MPLKPGYGRRTIRKNVEEMIKAGHPHDQAIAASLDNARKHASKVLKHMYKGGEVNEEEEGYESHDEPHDQGEDLKALGLFKTKVTSGEPLAFGKFTMEEPMSYMYDGGEVEKGPHVSEEDAEKMRKAMTGEDQPSLLQRAKKLLGYGDKEKKQNLYKGGEVKSNFAKALKKRRGY